MLIKRLKASNFKSFAELEVELRPFNLVVGPNAAGKSSFLEIFRFWRDLATEGLENAVSLQGGMTYLANLGTPRVPVTLELEARSGIVQLVTGMEAFSPIGVIKANALDRIDRISFQVDPEGLQAHMLETRTDLHCSLEIGDSSDHGIWTGHLIRSTTYQGEASSSDVPDESVDEHTRALMGRIRPLLGSLFYFDELGKTAAFDFDPKLLKGPQTARGRVRLDPDGGNLSIVLRHLLQASDRKESLLRLLRDLLPFAEDLRVEEQPDSSVRVDLAERFSDLRFVPSFLLSEGTVSVLALLIALFFDDLAPVTIIEEPEKSLHPHLISKLVGLMKEASRKKQVIVTTHNPQLLRYVDLEDILLVQRDRAGFSRISRPADSQEVRTFVENDLGADELFVQNLLGVGNEV